jgi:hypothetical protein
MSRLRESELAYARTLRRAADFIEGGERLTPANADEREDIAGSLRDLADTMEDKRL